MRRWIGEFSKTRKVIVVENDGHGRTTHVSLMTKGDAIIPIVNAFLGAKSQNQ